MNEQIQQRIEALGPAERLIQALLTHQDHMVHNRPGVLVEDRTTATGVRWAPVTHKVQEDGSKLVQRLDKVGKKTNKVDIGTLGEDGTIRLNGQLVGRYQPAGLFNEVAVWMYKQVADIYKMDQDFVAHWASYAFGQEHRDLKVVLCAFMLVQNRSGEPVREGGEILFHDDDFREIGEAMMLIRRADKKDLNPKLLLRVGDLLALPDIAKINRELGFGNSAKNAPMGRYPKAVAKWLRQRERNPKMLAGLIKSGFRKTVMQLSQRIGYKPEGDEFFQALRWKQKQSADGRRAMAIGVEVEAAETWEGLTEEAICQKIVADKPNYKRVVGLLPKEIGLTPAIMAAIIEAGAVSNKDLIILTPTLEDLGLLNHPAIKTRWEGAIKAAEDMRAANIASRVKNQDLAEELTDAADNAAKKAMEEVVKGLRIYVAVDISGSMSDCIVRAKSYLAKLLVGFPLDKLTVAVFNSDAREVVIKHPSSAGVNKAFENFGAGGGTNHGAAVRNVFAKKPPGPDEDAFFIWIGDQGQYGTSTDRIRESGLNPLAFGLLKVGNQGSHIVDTAAALGIPCFDIDENMFDDPYAVTRTLRNMIAATPVNQVGFRPAAVRRATLVEQILNTPKLTKPVWAA